VLFLCLLGFAFLIVGTVMASSPAPHGPTQSITNYGTIVYQDDSDSSGGTPEQASEEPSLDLKGYFVAFAGVGFFAAAFLRSRRVV
jgi:hypothetical protein